MRVDKIALLLLAGGALFIAGYRLGSKHSPLTTGHDQLNRENAEALDGSKPQVQDAIRRWSLKAAMSEDDVRRDWSPRAMFIPTRNQGQGMLCIELHLKPGSLGGLPVYCYESDFFKPDEKMKLVAEYSDVE